MNDELIDLPKGICPVGEMAYKKAQNLVIPPGSSMGDIERYAIFWALEQCEGNQTHAADLLKISIKTIHNKLKEYGATAPAGKN